MAQNKKTMFRLCVMLFGISLFSMTGVSVSAAQKEAICDGVSIDGIDIGGMTKEEAIEALDAYVAGLRGKEIAVALDEEIAMTTVGDLGFNCVESDSIDKALDLGRVGNLIKRYKEVKDAKEVGVNYELTFHLDDQKLAEFVNVECSKDDKLAQNATVQRLNGQFAYTKEVIGRKVNVEGTSQMIQDAILTDRNHEDILLDAMMEEDIPQYGLDTVQNVNALLGTFTTNYSTSSRERKNNIANASRLISGSVVYPGETFSCYEKMAPFTTANGYYSAHAYVNGMVEDSIGGGVCQVSTTLYNAVLRSELEIVQRAEHSMTVSYVDVAFDAAIAGTYKDLKFKNNLDIPVLVEAIANGTTLTFNIYGAETRPSSHSVEFKSEVISKTEPPKDVITEDKTQPTTYRKVTQSAYTGYVAVLYKYIYENGQLVDKIQINKSTYKASPNYVTVGTMVVEEEEPENPEVEESTNPDKEPEEDPDKKPEKDPDKKPEKDPNKKPDKDDTDKKPVKDPDKEDTSEVEKPEDTKPEDSVEEEDASVEQEQTVDAEDSEVDD